MTAKPVARIEAVLLDAVGTILRLREPVGESYARIAGQHGVVLPAWRLDDGFQRILRSAPPMVFADEPEAALPARERDWWRARVRETFKATDQTARFADFEAFFAAVFAHYAGAAAWEAMPGASGALSALRADGRRLAVASNFDHRLAPLLQELGLASFFELVWGPAQARAAKPQPAFFRGLLARLGVAPAAAVHVGDDPRDDVAAARAAGLHTVAIVPPATLHDLPERIRAVERGDT